MLSDLLPIALIVVIVVCVFESCWRKCPPDKLMIVSGAGKMRSVSGKGTFVIPGFQRVDMLALGAVQVQLATENDIPTQDAILIHACAVANFQIGQTSELIETASKNYL
ncbi:MAG: flotillin family protein, partial [Collinsella sp.]|nr:flotillin family protein [Collinsella sp.]